MCEGIFEVGEWCCEIMVVNYYYFFLRNGFEKRFYEDCIMVLLGLY